MVLSLLSGCTTDEKLVEQQLNDLVDAINGKATFTIIYEGKKETVTTNVEILESDKFNVLAGASMLRFFTTLNDDPVRSTTSNDLFYLDDIHIYFPGRFDEDYSLSKDAPRFSTIGKGTYPVLQEEDPLEEDRVDQNFSICREILVDGGEGCIGAYGAIMTGQLVIEEADDDMISGSFKFVGAENPNPDPRDLFAYDGPLGSVEGTFRVPR